MKDWLHNLEWKFSTASLALSSRLKQLHFLWYEELDISTALRAYCRKHYKKDYYLLKSVPGIGGITATAILSELGDLRRFTRLDELASLVGLCRVSIKAVTERLAWDLPGAVTVT